MLLWACGRIGANIWVHSDVGFRYVRFHGILDDDMSTYLNGAANMFNVFSIYDFLLSIDMKPIVEVSFMPSLLSANASATIFHYNGGISIPADWNAWGTFITQFTAALVDRYGVEEVRQWRFEVFNEPQCGFLQPPTQQAYFTLYKYTAEAIKSVDSLLRVGGPATCQTGWLQDFVNFVQGNNVPLDFISSHLYPTDPNVNQTRDGFMQVIAQAAAVAGSAGVPLVMTEFNAGLGQNIADVPYSAAFVVRNHFASQGPALSNMDTLSFWTFSDIFEEQGFISTPYSSAFGMQNIYGVPKPVYRGFQVISGMYPSAVPVSAPGSPAALFATSGKVDAAVTVKQVGKTAYVYAVLDNFDVVGQVVPNATVTLTFKNITARVLPSSASLELIDSTHAFALPVWVAAGQPMYPKADQIAAEMAASQLVPAQIPLNCAAATCSVTFAMQAISVARLRFTYQTA